MQWVKNRLLTFVGIALIGFAASAPIAVLSVNPAFAQDPPAQSQATEERSCAVEKVGWLVCPIIEHISSLGDFAFSILSNMFLETEPELVANNSGTFDAWSIARDLANILFAIAFLIIVLSQITGFGLTNYGIKRMLPRLIVAAIAVNASYWICQALVDLSNIGGWVIKDFLSDIASQVSNKSAMAVNIQGTDFQTSNGALGQAGGVLTKLAVGVLALGSVLFFLPILGSVATMVFLTCLSVIIILLLRKAIIVLLVVISPIAFVLYLLPNTERLFNRWLKMFIQLLMVFPVVSLLFGGGQLASAVVLAAGSNGDVGIYESGTGKCISLPSSRPEASTTSQTALGNCGRNGTPIILGIIAAGIAVAPLIAVWPVLQGALAATGSIGGKIQALSSKSVGAGRKRLSEDREHLSNRRTLAALNNPRSFSNIVTAGAKRRKVFRDYARAGTKAELDYAAQKETADKVTKSASYRRQVAGGNAMIPESINIAGKSLGMSGTTVEAIDRAKGRALGAQSKQAQEEIQNAQVIINTETRGDMDAIAAALTRAIENGNEVGAKAAQSLLLGMGGSGIDKFAKTIIEVEKSGGTEKTSFLRQYTAQNHSDIKQKSGDISGWMSNQTGSSLQSFSVSRDSFTLSDDEIASQTVGALHAAFMSDALNHEDADRILRSNSAAKLGQEQRAMLKKLRDGRGAYSARNVALANPPDPKKDRTI